MDIAKKLQDPATAAAAGGTAALVAAMFVPAALILGVAAATVGGMYVYNSRFAKPKAAKDEIIDIKPEQGGEEK